MSQILTQNVAAEVVVLLTKDNAPVAGLVFSDLTVEYRKEGDVGFTAKVLAAPDVVEHGDGVYTIAFTAAELDTVGSFTVKVQSATIDQYVVVPNVVAQGQASTAVSLETCILTGHVFDAAGQPIPGAAVSARVLGLPSIEQNQAAVTDDLVTATTDASGEFFLTLVRLADVEVFIPEANYRRRLRVPNSATANLFTEVP
jgi:hypothetical protein